MTPKITIEKSKGQHIETLITFERSQILIFRKKLLTPQRGNPSNKINMYF